MKRIVAAVCGLLAIPMLIVGDSPPHRPTVLANASERSMENRQILSLNEMLNAVNAGDAKRYAGLYAQDAVITIYGGDALRGRSAIEQYEVELLREFPAVRLAFYTVWQKGLLAVVHYGVNGRTPGGQLMGHEGLLFYRFDPLGSIEQERRYVDSTTPMAQMGMLGALPARPVPTLPAELTAYVAKNSPGENENVALVRASFAALNSKNEAAFLSRFARDAVLDELILPQPFVGKEKVKIWFQTWTDAVPNARFQITNILGVGAFVLVEAIVHGTLKGSLGFLSASSKKFAVHRALLLEVREGKFTHIIAFMNGKELATAVGQWQAPAGK